MNDTILKVYELARQRYNSKTWRAAVIGLLITVLEANLGVVSQLVDPQYRPFLVLIWPALMLAMREWTKEPLSAK